TAAAQAESFKYEETLGTSLVRKEPVGVVGCITPWNYPLHQIAAKVAYAMAAGCTVVLKPSEVAPLDAFILAEVIDDVGLPAGVFNMVTGTGPAVSQAQVDRVNGYIQKGIDEGAKLVTGGTGKPEGLEDGYFVKPTVFSEVRNDMTIAQEEIFGPVLSIIPFDDEAEAVAIANDSPYGPSGGLWPAGAQRPKGVARQLRTGQLEVTGGALTRDAPFGGYRQAGYRRGD